MDINKVNKNRYLREVLFTVILFVVLGKSETINDQCYVEEPPVRTYVESNKILNCNHIPKALPTQYRHVRILDFKRKYNSISLNTSSFTDESWANVQTIEFTNTIDKKHSSLTFSQKCFQGLRSLKELKIHVTDFHLDADAFVGLPLVHTLDVSKCYRLTIDNISNALQLKRTLPELKTLIMSGIGAYRRNNISRTVAQKLFQRNLRTFDISGTQINFINITALSKILRPLQIMNISHSVISEMWISNIVLKGMSNVKVLDASHIVLPATIVPTIPGKNLLINQTVQYSNIGFKNGLYNLCSLVTVNISRVVPEVVSVWLYNCMVILDESSTVDC